MRDVHGQFNSETSSCCQRCVEHDGGNCDKQVCRQGCSMVFSGHVEIDAVSDEETLSTDP